MPDEFRPDEHLPERPEWDCRVCTQPWPCANAKTDMLDEFRIFPTVLGVYMGAQLEDATSDLTAHGQSMPSDLYERFLAWTRRRPPFGFRQPLVQQPSSPSRVTRHSPASPSPGHELDTQSGTRSRRGRPGFASRLI